jgi:hypothetical protein
MCPISRLITAGEVAALPSLSIGQVSSVKDGWLLIFYFLYFLLFSKNICLIKILQNYTDASISNGSATAI